MQLKAAMEHKHAVHSVDHLPTLGRWLEVNVYPSYDGMSIFLRDLTDDKKVRAPDYSIRANRSDDRPAKS
jgi:hypothetical protein